MNSAASQLVVQPKPSQPASQPASHRTSHPPALEPQQAQHATQAHLLLEDLGDGHASVDELLASLVTDARHERGWFPDQAQLLQGGGHRGGVDQ